MLPQRPRRGGPHRCTESEDGGAKKRRPRRYELTVDDPEKDDGRHRPNDAGHDFFEFIWNVVLQFLEKTRPNQPSNRHRRHGEDRNPDRKISARPAVDISDRVEAVSLKGRRVLGKIAGMATHQAGGVQRPTGITRRVYRAQYIDCQQDSEYAEGAGGSNRRVERWRLAQAKLVQPFDLLHCGTPNREVVPAWRARC